MLHAYDDDSNVLHLLKESCREAGLQLSHYHDDTNGKAKYAVTKGKHLLVTAWYQRVSPNLACYVAKAEAGDSQYIPISATGGSLEGVVQWAIDKFGE